LLYLRYLMAHDLEGARGAYGTDAAVIAVSGRAELAEDPAKFWAEVGAASWKTVLTDAQKGELRARFLAWRFRRAETPISGSASPGSRSASPGSSAESSSSEEE
jgi:hypothetical protein